jgi:hypothetical protein
VLRRVIVAVAVCGLLAGCSGAKPTASAADRRMCQAVKSLPPSFASTLASNVGSPYPSDTAIFYYVPGLALQLKTRIGRKQTPGDIAATFSTRELRQLHNRCAALGL